MRHHDGIAVHKSARPLTELEAQAHGRYFTDTLRAYEPGYLLHLVGAPYHDKYEGPSPGTAALLRSGRAAAAVGRRTVSAWIDPGEWAEWAMPRGMPLRDFPVAGDPVLHVWRDHAMGLARAGDPADVSPRLGLRDAVAGAVAAVVHVPDGLDADDPVRARTRLNWTGAAADVLDAVGWDGEVLVVSSDGRSLGGRSALDALALPIRAWRRFGFSYAVNLSVLALPHLVRALEVPDAEAVATHLTSWRPPRPDGDVQGRLRRGVEMRIGTGTFWDPLGLQALYALRRKGGVEVGTLVPDGREWDVALATAGSPDGAWHGSGKHPARRVTPYEARKAAMMMFGHMLVVSDGGRVRLSRIGQDFLDGLHPACEDADMPLRWHGRWHERDPAGGRAMDAWIARTFSKLKAR